MSAKVDEAAVVETHRVQNSAAATSSISPAGSSKISMFKGKAGFVIPKNKFSGSLVRTVKGGKTSESNDTASEESNKQVQRKTKWGPDLTQDTSVRRGRALAYQTRVDQITQQLKLGSLTGDSQNSKSAGDFLDSELSTMQIDYEKFQALELERREAIGEILKLLPGYKAPSDYQPVMREATVPIPVKEHPGYDFVSLLYGPDGDTHKRLEKDTGTKIQVYGTKSEALEKVEIAASDRSEVLGSCGEVYVQISAETYEKVDAAAALIELLLSSVSGKFAASKASTSVSGDNAQALSEVQDVAPVTAVSTAMTSQELIPVIGPVSTSSQGPFHPYPGPWFPTSQSNMSSGLAPVPSSVGFTFNPSPRHLVFGPRPTPPYGFGSSPQSIPVGPSRFHPPVQGMQGPFVPPYSLGQTGPPRNHSTAPSLSPLVGQQPTAAGSPSVPAPQLAERSLNPTSSSPRWTVPPAGGSHSQGPVVSQSLASPALPSVQSVTPQAFPSPQVTPGLTFVSSQIRASSAMPVRSFVPQAPLVNSSTNSVLRPAQTPGVGTSNVPSFTPLKPMGGAPPRPSLTGPGDFTFQPHRPQGPPQSIPGPGVHFTPQRPPPPQLPPSPQASSFRPTLQTAAPQHVRPNFQRPQVGIQMGPAPGQFRHASSNPNMGPRNLGPVPQMPNSAGSFPPRVGHSTQYHQSYPAPPLGRPGGPFVVNQHSRPSGRPHVYDPFSPTAVSDQGSNTAITRKQESDPEYEDLMASVGVK